MKILKILAIKAAKAPTSPIPNSIYGRTHRYSIQSAYSRDLSRPRPKRMEKMAKGHKKVCRDKNRRYQGFDPKVPISRRQKMKRKEWEQSHSDNNTMKVIQDSKFVA
jgi:hypothetical protein